MVNQINPVFKDKTKYTPIWKIIPAHKKQFLLKNQIA